MQISLRGSIFMSAVMHAALLAPFYHQALFRADFAKHDSVVVDYVILKEMTGAALTNVTHKEAAQVSANTGGGGIEIKSNEVQQAAFPAVKHGKAAYMKRLEARKKRELEVLKKEVQTKANREYLNYYEVLKNRIKTRLQNNYRFYKGEGDVYLSFALDAGGKLLAYDVDRQKSSKDEVLIQMACASLKGVSPFPPLPKIIATDKTSFNIIISFKK